VAIFICQNQNQMRTETFLPDAMKNATLAVIITALSLLVGCASGPQESMVPASMRLPIPEVAPTILHQEDAVYPEPKFGTETWLEGDVDLVFVVETDGSVKEVFVEQSAYPALADAAVAMVKKWRFVPASTGGVPVRAAMSLPLTFSQDDYPQHIPRPYIPRQSLP
jgi:TonB family protein